MKFLNEDVNELFYGEESFDKKVKKTLKESVDKKKIVNEAEDNRFEFTITATGYAEDREPTVETADSMFNTISFIEKAKKDGAENIEVSVYDNLKKTGLGDFDGNELLNTGSREYRTVMKLTEDFNDVKVDFINGNYYAVNENTDEEFEILPSRSDEQLISLRDADGNSVKMYRDQVLTTFDIYDSETDECVSCADEYVEDEEDLSENYPLEPQFDTAKSFYGKAYVDDSNDGNRLFSYGTFVAEIKDGKPVVHNLQSSTTLRHVKEWLKQLGFEAKDKKQIIRDYGAEDIITEEFDEDGVDEINESYSDSDIDRAYDDIIYSIADRVDEDTYSYDDIEEEIRSSLIWDSDKLKVAVKLLKDNANAVEEYINNPDNRSILVDDVARKLAEMGKKLKVD